MPNWCLMAASSGKQTVSKATVSKSCEYTSLARWSPEAAQRTLVRVVR
jgi:hypothetical protein